MHSTQMLIDLAKVNSNIQSDYKLGVVLGLTDSAIPNYRKGKSFPNDAIAQRLAELAGLDVGYVLACIHAERSKEEPVRAAWERIASRMAQAGAAAALGAVMVVGSPDAMARTHGSSSSPAGASLYIMSNKTRRAWRRLQAWWARSIPLNGESANMTRDIPFAFS